MGYEIRLAEMAESREIQTLIERSARALGRSDYSAAQIEGALKGAFGLDTQLIQDRTFFVAETEGRLAACAGWSFRRTLFGGDSGRADQDRGNQNEHRDPETLDPAVDPARIRAFFVCPDHARQGLGSLLLDCCEMAARERGFRRATLMATLTGQKLYAARGYLAGESIDHPLGPGLTIPFVAMEKELPP